MGGNFTVKDEFNENSMDELVGKTQLVKVVNKLVPEEYDNIALAYTGDDLVGVTYKQGSTIVATLVLAYVGGQLISVTKT